MIDSIINNIHIQNYQSHKNTKLKFSRGVNVITGTSDSGKSSILRALRWVTRNRPSGEAFRSIWGGNTKVTLILDNKQKIERFKSDKENKYIINNKSYLSFKQDTPEDVKKLLNMSDVNSQGQFDPPFLLSQSAGEVARYLNKVVQLDKIDLANSNINSAIRKEKQDLQYQKERNMELDEKLRDYVWLDEAGECLVKLEQFEARLIGKKQDRKEIIQLRDNIIVVRKRIEEINEIVQYEKEVSKLIEFSSGIKKKQSEVEGFKDLFNKINITKNSIKNLNREIETNQREFNKLIPKNSLCPLCGGRIK